MDAEDFINYLGKADNTPEIRQLLSTLGVQKHPKIKKGDTDARVSLPGQGLTLLFEESDVPKSSLTVLNEVQFYRGGKPQEMPPFAGRLPFGLSFTDSRAAVRKKLGKPADANDEMDVDTWDYENCTLTVEYADQRKAIALVHLEMPFEAADDEDD